MRSDWRGVARGTAPKRSKSARGPPVCINSMAQHANPNSMYHCEEALPQLSKSSTFVVKTVSGSEFINGFIALFYASRPGESNLDLLNPVQVSFDPGVDQAQEQDADEDENFNERKKPLSGFDPSSKHRSHWKYKRYFDFKDDENQGHDIETNIKIDPCAAHCRFTAFVSGEFTHLRVRRPEQPSNQQIDADKTQP